jgi:homoprotocatechuate degradation regulator HpaR
MALLRARELTMSYFRPLLNAHGLTEQQWRVIRVLQEYGELEFRDLSRVAWIQPASLTGILTRLERAALVRRTRSRSDQRRLHLSLSRPGCDDSRPSASKQRSATDRSSGSSGVRGSRP